ncbi:MAG: hypothetical protein M1824_005311 [Vezdaea acicularis]|nr:MAG: hypothetical protein M1824_005311 [Vezdaea acicularis]
MTFCLSGFDIQSGLAVLNTLIIFTLTAVASAAPEIAFPINSQVPPIARVSQPFNFVFSQSTFTSPASNLSYALVNNPHWLALDGRTRTFSGTPGPGDVGPVSFSLTATDPNGTAASNVTFIISSDHAPQVVVPIEDQTLSSNAKSGSDGYLTYPSSPFVLSFAQNTFSSAAKSLQYYASSSDGTPLPSWVKFDSTNLKFSGITPSLSSLVVPPQTFGLQLIASDIEGFSGSAINFNLIVGTHELSFKSVYQSLNISRGQNITIDWLKSNLTLDGRPIKDSDIKSATAQTPSWLQFDSVSLLLSGTPPKDVNSTNVTVSAFDVFEDTANVTIQLNLQSTLFLRTVNDINATLGQPFDCKIGRGVLSDPSTIVSVTETPETPWLHVDPSALELSGNVPDNIPTSQISINLTAISSGFSDFQIFKIEIIKGDVRVAGSSAHSGATSTLSPTGSAQTSSNVNAQGAGNNKSTVLPAVLVPLLILTVALVSIILCARRKQKASSRPATSIRKEISRPINSNLINWPAFEKEPEDDANRSQRSLVARKAKDIWASSTNLRRKKYGRTNDVYVDGSGNPRTQGSEFSISPRGEEPGKLSKMPNYSLKSPIEPTGTTDKSREQRESSPERFSNVHGLRRQPPHIAVPSRIFDGRTRGRGMGHGSGGVSQSSSEFGVMFSRPSWKTISRRTGSNANTFSEPRASGRSGASTFSGTSEDAQEGERALQMSYSLLSNAFPSQYTRSLRPTIREVRKSDRLSTGSFSTYLRKRAGGESPFFQSTSNYSPATRNQQSWKRDSSISGPSGVSRETVDVDVLLEEALEGFSDNATAASTKRSISHDPSPHQPSAFQRLRRSISQRLSQKGLSSSRFQSAASSAQSDLFSTERLEQVERGGGEQSWETRPSLYRKDNSHESVNSDRGSLRYDHSEEVCFEVARAVQNFRGATPQLRVYRPSSEMPERQSVMSKRPVSDAMRNSTLGKSLSQRAMREGASAGETEQESGASAFL